MEFKELLKSKRLELNITMEDVAKKVGVSKATVQRWESGEIENIRRDKIAKLANALQTTPAYLMGWENTNIYNISNIEPLPQMKKVPIVGTIACGTPILATENIEDYADIPNHIKADYALRCKGDSMINLNIYDGSLVFIHQQPTVENGEVAAVLIDNEATLKRFYQNGDTVILQPENSAIQPLVYSGEQLNEIQILGKAIYHLSYIK